MLELYDHTAGLEILTMYVIKEGDRLPGIAGRITVPFGIDLTGAQLYLTYAGRTTDARTVAIAASPTLAEDSPALDNEDEAPTIWDWHHPWGAGATTGPDRYRVGISTEIGGLQITLPNDGWGEFVIQAQLTPDPVP